MDVSLVVAVVIAVAALVSELLLAWFFKGWAQDELSAGRTALTNTVMNVVAEERAASKEYVADVVKAVGGIGPAVVEGLAPIVADALVRRGAADMADKSNAHQAMMKAGLQGLDLDKLMENPEVRDVLGKLQAGGQGGANPTMKLLKGLIPKQYHGLLAGLELKSALGGGGRSGGGSNGSRGWWDY